MSNWLVSIRRGADREAFTARMTAADVAWTAVEGLPRHFIVTGAFPLAGDPDVEFVNDGDETMKPAQQDYTIPADLSEGSWALSRIIRRNAPWNVDRITHPIESYFRSERDGTGVDVYVLDGGFDPDHPEINPTSVYEWEAAASVSYTSHGTAVMSCACGSTVGVARGANLFSLKITNSTDVANLTSFVTCVGQLMTHYNARSNPAVCSISYTFSLIYESAVSAAMEDMIDAGIVVSAAVGNGKSAISSVDVYPAESLDVIAVGGCAMNDLPYANPRGGTNYGPELDIVAPGQDVRVADAGGTGFRITSGTSFSTPFVAGVVACMLQGHAKLTTRAKVNAVQDKLIENGTTGKLRAGCDIDEEDFAAPLLYLDPDQTAPETIPGL